MHRPEDLLPFLGQLRSPRRRDDTREEAGDPFLVLRLPGRGLLPLALLKFLLELRRLAVPLVQDGRRHLGPELAGLVRQLILVGREDLVGREERGDVYEELRLLRTRQRVVDPLLPGAGDPGEDVGLGDVADLHPGVVVRVVAEDDPLDFVLGATQPAFLQVLQDDFYARLRTRHVACIRHGDGEGAPQQTAEVSMGMREPVLLVVPVLQLDEDPMVVFTGTDADAGARELGADLVVAASRDASFGTVDVVGGDRRVMGGLLGQVGYLDPGTVAVHCGGAIRCCAAFAGGEDSGCSVFSLPVTLRKRNRIISSSTVPIDI